MNQSKSKRNQNLPQQLRLENQVCFPLYSASNAVIRAYRPYLEELNITYLQYIVLMVLWEQGSLNVKELGRRLMLNSGTLTPLLKRLASKGLVERKRSEEDERARVITLTDEGRDLQDQAESIPHKLVCSLGLEKAELQQIKQLCEKVLMVLGDDI
ncbi:MAG: MarR family transcriptional regulator [Kangiellaceae bacterium]|nr:MarR family transcriptional regulator [Kangiellaceae bacterium]MCW9015656.1 MarR family transcriptional regulator [Kangiellaceae bacterium]